MQRIFQYSLARTREMCLQQHFKRRGLIALAGNDVQLYWFHSKYPKKDLKSSQTMFML